MELKWLEDFVAVARTGSFSQAARERHVTQPAFSRRVRALEHWLGVELVHRTQFPVMLTRHGEEFLPTAQEMIAAALRARQDFRHASRAAQRQVRVVTLHTLAVHVVPKLVAPFLRAEPRASVDIIPNVPGVESYFDALASGLAHIVIAYGQQTPPHGAADLVVARIARDELVPVASPALVAAQPKVATLEAKAVPVVLYTPFSFSHGLIEAVLARLGPRLVPRAVSPLGETMKPLIVDGIGVGWLPRHAIEPELAAGTLVEVGDAEARVPVEVVAWRRSDLADAAALEFFAILEGAAANAHAVSA